MPTRPKNAAELAENPPVSEWSPNVDYENVIDYVTLPAGKHFDIDLASLIQSVVVAPSTPNWIIALVRDVAEKYGYTFPVESSAMLLRPRYGSF